MRYGPLVMFFWFPVLFVWSVLDVPLLLLIFVACIIRRVFFRRKDEWAV